MDWSLLIAAIDFGALGAGVLGAGAALIGVYLTIKGVRVIIILVRGDDDSYDGSGSSGLDFRDLTGPVEYDGSRDQVQDMNGDWYNKGGGDASTPAVRSLNEVSDDDRDWSDPWETYADPVYMADSKEEYERLTGQKVD
jgi:hypothetical protein